MNDSFFQLSEEKRNAIINAGYRVFSQNTYKKSPMSEIAAEAGISKSLLFYYFRNKKELYLYLLRYSTEATAAELAANKCFDGEDFFEIFLSSLKVKISLMQKYPELSMFDLKAYYEKEPELREEINAMIGEYSGFEVQGELLKLHKDKFREGLDLRMVYKDIYYACEGYLWEKMCSGNIDTDEIEKDFRDMIAFWKSVYYRKEKQP